MKTTITSKICDINMEEREVEQRLLEAPLNVQRERAFAELQNDVRQFAYSQRCENVSNYLLLQQPRAPPVRGGAAGAVAARREGLLGYAQQVAVCLRAARRDSCAHAVGDCIACEATTVPQNAPCFLAW